MKDPVWEELRRDLTKKIQSLLMREMEMAKPAPALPLLMREMEMAKPAPALPQFKPNNGAVVVRREV